VKATDSLSGVAILVVVGILSAGGAAAQTIETVTLRGCPQSVRVYGVRGVAPIIVSSGDGGWIHLGPHVAEVLAAHGFFVVGFDVKMYLESFTSALATLRSPDEPGDYQVLAMFASRGTVRKPVLIGVSEGVITAAGAPKTLWIVKAMDHRFSDNLPEFDRRLLEAVHWVAGGTPR
jgi:Bacterial virulence protein (VirJ)